MSDSIPTQWILQYLIQVAETFGKSFTEIPIDAISPVKKKRVQIIEFLTYNEDSEIWGRVSDKKSLIPVCFTKAAVSQYMKELHGRRLTEAKNAIFCIGQLRPIFVRIPVGNNRPKLSEESHVALEAGIVKYIGPGLGVCGSPRNIELNSEVTEWVRGLRRSADGGDVLKCRKQDAKHASNSPLPVHEPPSVTYNLEEPPRPLVREPEPNSPHIVSELPVRSTNPMREYRKRWIYYEKNRQTHVINPCVHDKVQALVDEQPRIHQLLVQDCVPLHAAIVVAGPQPCTPPRAHTPERDTNKQTTPGISEWSPSVHGSPAGVLPCTQTLRHNDEVPDDHATKEPSTEENRTLPESFTSPATSPLRPPTPAQRVKRPFLPSEPLLQSAPSSPNSSFMLAPPSSFPVHVRKNIKRKVPHPGSPPSHTDGLGSTQILVPTSDTSGTQSQSRSQTRSQLLSQSQSHRLASSSQLTQEFKPGQTSTPATVNQGASVKRASQMVDAVDGADVPAVFQAVSPSPTPFGEPSDGSKPISAPSPAPSHSSMHSLFSGSPSLSASHLNKKVVGETSIEQSSSLPEISRNLSRSQDLPLPQTISRSEKPRRKKRKRRLLDYHVDFNNIVDIGQQMDMEHVHTILLRSLGTK